MSYIDPETVRSPVKSWELDRVLINRGDGSWSLARGRWDGSDVYAIRWNGSNQDTGIGNPQSHGYPTWFVLPDEIAEMVIKSEREKMIHERCITSDILPRIT